MARRAFAEELATERAGQGNPARTRTLELELPCKDGSRTWVESKISFLRDENGQPQELIAVSRDISERKRAEADRAHVEERARQAQKMEAVGRLAAGIAHDFNNLLTVIIGRSQIAGSSLPPDSPLRHHFQEIEQTGMRAAGLTRQLLSFSRQQLLEPKLVDLNVVVDGVERLLRRVIGEDIELEIVLEPGLGITKADPSQLEQVLLNLAVNSRDAMPQGGRLAIVTSNFELDAVHERSHPGVAPGLYVVLTVSDTGHGMDAATRARIFEPFFTTKALDKGTGLGLATVHGIVEQSGGTILVDSEVGQGTTFRIYLPRVSAPTRAPVGAAAAVTASRGTETILLVEDDQQLRAITQEILEVMGYVVLAAPGPDQALALAAHQERINLLLTDIVMPTMNGFMLAGRLKQAHPRMRVLCMSGYAGHVIAEQNVTGLSISLLQKPFTVEMLTAKVREVLDAPAP
jgi:two-component system, cell cycle sensor histidine kinase and response regulator CckA